MSWLVYLHPVFSLFILGLMIYLGMIGLTARRQPRKVAALLARHRSLGPLVFWGVVLSWLGGLFSTWYWRPQMEAAASTHFRVGTILLLALIVGFISAQRMNDRRVRQIHPWFGAAAMLLAAVQVFFGLQITP